MKNLTKFIIIMVISAFFISATVITEIDNSKSFSFIYQPEKLNFKNIKLKNENLIKLEQLDSDRRFIDKYDNEIPGKAFFIGVPKSGNIKVFVEPIQTRKVKLNFSLMKALSDDSLPHVSEKSWSTQPKYVHFRKVRAAQFTIIPFQYNQKSQSVTVLEKAKIRIEFPKSKLHKNFIKKGAYSDYLNSTLLNYKTALGFYADNSRQRVHTNLSRAQIGNSETVLMFKIGDGNTGINETTGEENGIVKIMASDVQSSFGSNIPISSFTLLGSIKNELDLHVPVFSEIPNGVSEIPLMRFDLDNNGFFNGSDYLLAYVSALSDWVNIADTVGSVISYKTKFNYNRVENNRTYWLKSSGYGPTITKYNYSGSSPLDTLSSVWKTRRYKKSRYLSHNNATNEAEGGIDWVWDRLTNSNNSFYYTLDILDEIDTTFLGFIHLEKKWNNSKLDTLSFAGKVLGATDDEWLPITNWPSISNPLEWNLSLSIYNATSSTLFEVEYIDFRSKIFLDMKNKNSIRFFSDTLKKEVTYKITNKPNEKLFVFRIAPNESEIQLIDTVSSSGNYYFSDSSGNATQYFITKESEITTLTDFTIISPKNSTEYQKFNLRSSSNSSDYLIITHKNFINEALRLAKHKKKIGSFNNPVVVDVDDVYREFAGGNRDYTAIRNFLSFAHNGGWSSAPDYVLLMGDGHYKYKGYITISDNSSAENYIPTCQFSEYCIDDFYTYLDSGDYVGRSGEFPDIFLGRLTVNTESEASAVVNKIIEFEGANADFGAWRNTVLLLSDDDQQLATRDNIKHYESNAAVWNIIKDRRPSTNLKTVTLFEYPWNSLWRKPEAANALASKINNGVGCINFFGHGSREILTDERVLTKENIVNLTNAGKYPILTAFSCNLAQFDTPGKLSIAGDLVNQVNSGTIVSIASTRTAWAGANTDMAKAFYKAFTDKVAKRSVGQSYSEAKKSKNLKYYALIGDPSLGMPLISDSVAVDIYSETGVLTDTIKALEKIKLRGKIGSITSGKFNINTTYGSDQNSVAYVNASFYYPDRTNVTRKDGGSFSSPQYTLAGESIRPDTVAHVKNGEFEIDISIPKRVPFNQENPILRIYAWRKDGSRFATCIRKDFIFSGSVSGDDADNTGPSISFKPFYKDKNGNPSTKWNNSIGIDDTITVTLPMSLKIDLWDESGIQVSGDAPGEGLTFEIEGVIPAVSIASEYTVDAASKGTAGSAFHSLDTSDISSGVYTLNVGAMDINGNISRKSVVLKILSDDKFEMGSVFNYPNPVQMGKSTKIYFYHTNLSEQTFGGVDAEVRIYSLSGKLLRVFKNAVNGEIWDLRDQRGVLLTPNIYLYRVVVKMDGDSYYEKDKIIKSPIKKIVIQPPS